MKITVVDYGLSNLLSVRLALEHCGAETELVNTPDQVLAARALVLPGVGAFRDGMEGLEKLGLVEALRTAAQRGTPLLGICLGMQMLLTESEEFGLYRGLDLIPGRVERLPDTAVDGSPERVPHIGWEALQPAAGRTDFAGTILEKVRPGEECYFIHSYEAKPADPAYRQADAVYGGRPVCAAVCRGNVIGTQFHPEKSGPVGLRILQSFLTMAGN